LRVRRSALVATLAATAALAPAATAGAAPNPYSPREVCGSGFQVIDRHRDVPKRGKRVHMATTYLLYEAATGRNCATTIKHRQVGVPTYTAVSLQPRGRLAAWRVDYGDFAYYAGPVYRHAPGRCVRYGSALAFPNGRESLFISPFGHCR